MSKTYRVAFAGAGGIVQAAHIPNFQSLSNVETVALADVNESRAKSVAAEKKIKSAYTDFNTMLEKEQPDIVVIASPNVFHKPMAMAALDAGAHVLCEKPLALTYTDSVELFEKAASKKRVLTVGTHYRFTDPMQLCKAHVDGNFFGNIYAARTTYCRRSGIPGYGSWFTNKDLAGGGVLFDLGVHALDRALYLMGYPKPVAVSGATYAEFGTRGMGLGGWGKDIQKPSANTRFDVEDFSWAFVRFENGAVLQFSVSWAAHFTDGMTVELYGTDGGAHIMSSDKMELYTSLNGQNVTLQTPMPREAANSYRKLVENFVKYIDGDTTADIISPEQALVGVQIVDAIQRSAASGREIVLA